MRNPQDLNCMAVPQKYRALGDFHEYYSGARTAPYLTVFVGGNHEASNHLFELYYGGWAAPNIYYLGAANVVRVGPLRIAGLSGIWKGYSYKKPHHERLPYNQDDVRSAYHVRELDVRKLLQVRTQVDVAVSHDWPRAVEWSGDFAALFARKRDFEAEARAGTLGSVAARFVLDRLRPAYWFAAHMHIRFAATVHHGENGAGPNAASTGAAGNGVGSAFGGQQQEQQLGGDGPIKNEDEIDLDMGDLGDAGQDGGGTAPESAQKPQSNDQPADQPTVPQLQNDQLLAASSSSQAGQSRSAGGLSLDITNKTTNFLALDKCLPGRNFLEILHVKPVSKQAGGADGGADNFPRTEQGKLRLEYDKEWLAITRVFAADLALGDRHAAVPSDRGEAFYRQRIEEEERWVEENVVARHGLAIPLNFEPTAPAYDPSSSSSTTTTTATAAAAHNGSSHARANEMPAEWNNPQTASFCQLVGIENKFFLTDEQRAERMRLGPSPAQPRFGGGSGGGGGSSGGGKAHRGRGRGGGGRFGQGPFRGRGGWGGRGGGGGGEGAGRGGVGSGVGQYPGRRQNWPSS